MKYLLDTCVLSEVFKKSPSRSVLDWLSSVDENRLFISVLTLGEIEKGIIKARPERQKVLRQWVEDDLKQRFLNRIIPVDETISVHWGAIQGLAEKRGRPMSAIDGLIAVSAKVKGCTVVTRNVNDMQQSGVELLNPWNTVALT